ncbi:MAG: hypothetical protein IJI75_02385 [Solobacterium sp.]|nr:hypothetical protein [Solobacterium sp.]
MEKEINTIEDTAGFVNAECERCGGVLRVDQEKGEAVCPYCGAKYVIHKPKDVINHNTYNVNHEKNTVYVQHGKKGLFQSATDLIDRQLEREQNARIRAAELSLEQQKLDMIKEEKKKEARKSLWKKIAYFFGWIYCFPIPLTLIILKKDTLDKKKKSIIIGAGWAAYLLILLFAGMSGSDTEKTAGKESSAVQPAAVQTAAAEPTKDPLSYENKVQSDDFDTLQHITLQAGDYELEIPGWPENNGYYYAAQNIETGDFAEIWIYKSDENAGWTDDQLVQGRSQYIKGIMGSDGFRDPVLVEEESFTVNDVVMNSALIHTTVIGNNNSSLTGLCRAVWFLNPSDGSLIQIAMLESDDCKEGYYNDFWKSIQTVRLAQKDTGTQNTQENSSGMSFEEFKQKMDDLEQFFDSYCEFMKTYDSSNTAAMMQYLNMMNDYAKAMEALDSIDESQLTPEQDSYYLQVMLRIDQKLLEAANY